MFSAFPGAPRTEPRSPAGSGFWILLSFLNLTPFPIFVLHGVACHSWSYKTIKPYCYFLKIKKNVIYAYYNEPNNAETHKNVNSLFPHRSSFPEVSVARSLWGVCPYHYAPTQKDQQIYTYVRITFLFKEIGATIHRALINCLFQLTMNHGCLSR